MSHFLLRSVLGSHGAPKNDFSLSVEAVDGSDMADVREDAGQLLTDSGSGAGGCRRLVESDKVGGYLAQKQELAKI